MEYQQGNVERCMSGKSVLSRKVGPRRGVLPEYSITCKDELELNNFIHQDVVYASTRGLLKAGCKREGHMLIMANH
jgi:hypothetical protein